MYNVWTKFVQTGFARMWLNSFLWMNEGCRASPGEIVSACGWGGKPLERNHAHHEHRSVLNGRRIVLGVAGGISAYKAVEVLRLLTAAGADVRVIMTEAATRFVGEVTFRELSYHPVAIDLFAEPRAGDTMQHMSLAEQADLILVVPATANIMAKMACGMADNLLLATLLATRAPILLAPAMDHDMYLHPATQANIQRLASWGVHFVGPEEGQLARRNVGKGRLSDPEAIVDAAARILAQASAQGTRPIVEQATAWGEGAAVEKKRDLAGLRVLVTAGPTHEAIDPVRYIGNRSSGKMGFALAAAARRRGAEVILVSGPVSLPTPAGVTRINVTSALEMRAAVLEHFPDVDIVVKAAAVADYRVAEVAQEKLKRHEGGEHIQLQLVQNPDILSELGRLKKGHQLTVGFAAETNDVIAQAQRKLHAKQCDLLVANDVTEEGAGFDVDTNRVHILDREGRVESLPVMSKELVAEKIWDRVVLLHQAKEK